MENWWCRKCKKNRLAADQGRFLHSPWMDGACSFCGGYEWYEVCRCKACGLQCMWRLYICSMLWQLSIICDIFWQHLITFDLSKHFLKIVDSFLCSEWGAWFWQAQPRSVTSYNGLSSLSPVHNIIIMSLGCLFHGMHLAYWYKW